MQIIAMLSTQSDEQTQRKKILLLRLITTYIISRKIKVKSSAQFKLEYYFKQN